MTRQEFRRIAANAGAYIPRCMRSWPRMEKRLSEDGDAERFLRAVERFCTDRALEGGSDSGLDRGVALERV